MKRIEKSNCPVELTRWVKAQGEINCHYSHLPSELRATIKQRLLEEQGHICGYTGIRISDGRSHIEHLKPQSLYHENQEDLDYNNLIAAYPGITAPQCAYGAHPKADWYDETLFITPLNSHCETAFQFNLDGEITAIHDNPAAQITLERLNLTHPSLTEMRQQAIQTLLFESELSLQQAKDLLEKMYDRNSKGQFRPFCFVLKQACEEFIRRKKQKQTRQKAIQSQSKKQKK
jgi:uncharacterized protein (TIGR02646 family)